MYGARCELLMPLMHAQLFVECGKHSDSPLCFERPADAARVVTAIGYTLIAKGALTIVTFGIKLPGEIPTRRCLILTTIAGIFIPSLAVGACFGRIVGLCMEYIQYNNPQLAIFDVCKDTDCVLPGLYSMVRSRLCRAIANPCRSVQPRLLPVSLALPCH